MEHGEPTLPPLPAEVLASTCSRPSRPSLLVRKRTYDQAACDDEPLTATSSDPALFSGDEYESIGAENYAGKRKKKMYTGSWWNHRMKAGKEDKKKEFKRNYDSGIFMGSDSEPPSSDSITSLEEELIRDQARASNMHTTREPLSMLGQHLEETDPATPLAQRTFRRDQDRDLDATPRKRVVVRRNELGATSPNASLPEFSQRQAVVQIIRRSLDEGQETVDLSGHSLSDLPPEIAELAYLTKQTNLVTGMLESGASLEAHLRLFLGNNFLRQVPLPVMDLANLRELSLRRNKLTVLPAAIRNLVNLEKLNVSGNKLTYLPFEVMQLMAHHRLRELTTEPNLWEVPPELKQTAMARMRDRSMAGLSGPFPISAFDHNRKQTASGTVNTPLPSLVEMTLRQLVRLRPAEDLTQYMPPSTSVRVLEALQDLNGALQTGDIRCNSCQRLIVRAGAEWREWWIVDGSVMPIKRVQCVSGCAGIATAWCDK